MKLATAFLIVTFVWGSTPLAIQHSSQAFDPISALFFRILLATLIGYSVLHYLQLKILWSRHSLKVYMAGNVGISGAMLMVYLGSTQITSGLISVLFGLAPLFSGIISWLFFAGQKLSLSRWVACLLGALGLWIIFYNEHLSQTNYTAEFQNNTALGIFYIIAGVLLFCVSSLLIKHYTQEKKPIHPLVQSVGTLALSLPPVGLLWLLQGEYNINSGSLASWLATVYLAIFGSLIAIFCYFLLLNSLTAQTANLITLIAPVLALCLGAWFNGENLSSVTFIGVFCIMAALVFYFNTDYKGMGTK